MKSSIVLKLHIVLAVLIPTVCSFSYMVPQDSCFNMNPVHNSSKQLTDSPYKIYVGSNYFHHNDEIKSNFFLKSQYISK